MFWTDAIEAFQYNERTTRLYMYKFAQRKIIQRTGLPSKTSRAL